VSHIFAVITGLARLCDCEEAEQLTFEVPKLCHVRAEIIGDLVH